MIKENKEKEGVKDQKTTADKNSNQISVISMKAAKLNSSLLLCSKKRLISYPRWVQDTPQNREALKSFLIHSVLYPDHGRTWMKYLSCCNIFYFLKRRNSFGHKVPISVRDLLFTNVEKKQVRKFIKTHPKNKTKKNYYEFRKAMIPDLTEFVKGFRLKKLDAFIDSLPRNDRCFEFPLVRSELKASCVEGELIKIRREVEVKKRHDLVYNPPKLELKPESREELGRLDRELSPAGQKIHSLQESSSKKLKTKGPVNPPELPRRDRKEKKTPSHISVLISGLEETAHGKIFEGMLSEVAVQNDLNFSLPQKNEPSKQVPPHESIQNSKTSEEEEIEDLAHLMSKMSFFSDTSGLCRLPQPLECPQAVPLLPDEEEANEEASGPITPAENGEGSQDAKELVKELNLKCKELVRISIQLKKVIEKKGTNKSQNL